MNFFINCVIVTVYFIFGDVLASPNVVLTDKNWRNMLEGEWMVKFYAPWCPACRAMTGTWNDFASWAKKDNNHISVGSVDVTAQAALNGRFMVTSLPTIYHVHNGEFRKYSSSRSLHDFKEFVLEEKWKTITPVSSWLSPDSFAMNSVSKLFSFSMALKSYHESLRTEYGLPGWASIVLLGLVIVIIGLILGIGLIIAVDWFMGPQQYPQEYMDRKKTDEPENDDEGDDHAEDEKNLVNAEEEQKDSDVRQRQAPTKD